MTSEQFIEKLLSKYFDECASPPARNFRNDLVHLMHLAKAEQRIAEAERLVSRTEFRDMHFSIDSWR